MNHRNKLKKQKTTYYISLATFFLTLNLFAQTTVHIGSHQGNNHIIEYNNSNRVLPITNRDYTYSQQIVKASEFSTSGGEAGQITKVRWKFPALAVDQTTYGNWDVYIAHTTKEKFNSTNDWISIDDLNLVFSGNIHSVTNPPTIDQWFELPFTTPFAYNGTDNIVIAVNEKQIGQSSGLTILSYWTDDDKKQGIVNVKNGGSPYNPATPLTGQLMSRVAQIQFDLTPCTPLDAGTFNEFAQPLCEKGWRIAGPSTVSGGTWTCADTTIATIDETTGYIIGKSGGTTNIIYTVKDANGCKGTKSIELTVKDLPDTGTINATANSVCVGDSITLSSTVGNGMWVTDIIYDDKVSYSSYDGEDIIVKGVSQGDVKVVYSVSESTGYCLDTTSITITVLPKPTIQLSPVSPHTICKGTEVTLVADIINDAIYSWDNGISDNGHQQNVSPEDTTIYSVIATDANGCTSDTATLTVNVVTPTTSVKVEGEKELKVGESNTYTGTPSTGTWDDFHNEIAKFENGILTAKKEGEVTLVYSVNQIYPCTGETISDSIKVTITDVPNSGIKELKDVSNVSIFPNPTNEEVKIQFMLQNSGDVTIKIIDLNGNICYEQSMDNVNIGLNELNLNISEYKNGVYSVMILSEQALITKKIIVNK